MCDGQDTINNSCFIQVTLMESVIFSQCHTPNNSLIIGLLDRHPVDTVNFYRLAGRVTIYIQKPLTFLQHYKIAMQVASTLHIIATKLTIALNWPTSTLDPCIFLSSCSLQCLRHMAGMTLSFMIDGDITISLSNDLCCWQQE